MITSVAFLFVNKQTGYFDIPLFNVAQDSVRIKFKNESGKTIKYISINGKEVPKIEHGDSYVYMYKHSGEGTYPFVVEFEDGSQLKEGERYVEPRYYITETIKAHSVETQY